MAMTSCLVSRSISLTLSRLTFSGEHSGRSLRGRLRYVPELGMGPGQRRLYLELDEEAVLLAEISFISSRP